MRPPTSFRFLQPAEFAARTVNLTTLLPVVRLFLAAVLVLFAAPPGARAQWQFNGVAVCDTPRMSLSGLPEIAPDGRGGAYVVWVDPRNGVDYDVFAQHVDSSGIMLWQRNGIAVSALPRGQDYAEVCSDGQGGMFTAWEDSRTATDTYPFAQWFDSGGTARWSSNGVQVSAVGGLFVRPAIDDRGGFLVGWTGLYDPRVQRLNSQGQRVWGDSGIRLSTRPGTVSSNDVAVTADGSGGAIVAWVQGQGTYAQRVDSGGRIRWAENGISLSGNRLYDRGALGMVPDMQGGAYVTWTKGGNAGVYLQHIASTGQVLWADTGMYVSWGGSSRNIVSDGDRGAIVTSGFIVGSTAYNRAYRFRPDGSQPWPGGVAHTREPYSEVALASDGAQGAFVAMTRAGGQIRVQWIDSMGTVRFDSNGVEVCRIPGWKEHPRITCVGPREAIVSWSDGRNNTYQAVYAAKVTETGVVTGAGTPEGVLPTTIDLQQNYPNPFNPETTIEYTVTAHQYVNIEITNVLGQRVASLVNTEQPPGSYKVTWKAEGLAAGVYYYQLRANGTTTTRKMILLR